MTQLPNAAAETRPHPTLSLHASSLTSRPLVAHPFCCPSPSKRVIDKAGPQAAQTLHRAAGVSHPEAQSFLRQAPPRSFPALFPAHHSYLSAIPPPRPPFVQHSPPHAARTARSIAWVLLGRFLDGCRCSLVVLPSASNPSPATANARCSAPPQPLTRAGVQELPWA